MAIESAIINWFVNSLEQQGATWGLMIISFWWLTKRIEYLDIQIATYNTFMRDCIEKQLNIKVKDDVFRKV